MNIMPRSWSGDGKALILEEIGAGINFDISAISMEGDRAKKPLLHEKHNELDPQISPDGRWMAYSCNESGQYEIYVHPYPEVNGGQVAGLNQRWKLAPMVAGWPGVILFPGRDLVRRVESDG